MSVGWSHRTPTTFDISLVLELVSVSGCTHTRRGIYKMQRIICISPWLYRISLVSGRTHQLPFLRIHFDSSESISVQLRSLLGWSSYCDGSMQCYSSHALSRDVYPDQAPCRNKIVREGWSLGTRLGAFGVRYSLYIIYSVLYWPRKYWRSSEYGKQQQPVATKWYYF